MEVTGAASEVEMDGLGDSLLPTWTLYDNPFFFYHFNHQHHHPYHHRRRHHRQLEEQPFPWDFASASEQSSMDSEEAVSPSSASVTVRDLKAELQTERRMRRKAEALNKVLARELVVERRRREAAERGLEELAEEARWVRAEMGRLRGAVGEERRMMRTAEVLREERAQMKLMEARHLMEERLLQISKKPSFSTTHDAKGGKDGEGREKNRSFDRNGNSHHDQFHRQHQEQPPPPPPQQQQEQGRVEVHHHHQQQQHHKQRKEVENPHIKRGIVGFVEFPRMVRTRGRGLGSSPGSRETKGGRGDTGPKLECQKAQLRVLLKNNRVNPVGNLCASGSDNLVM